MFTVGVAAVPTNGGRIRRGVVWTLDAITAGALIGACRAFEEGTRGRCYTVLTLIETDQCCSLKVTTLALVQGSAM